MIFLTIRPPGPRYGVALYVPGLRARHPVARTVAGSCRQVA